MYFSNLEALLYMDGHGAFVWSAYGITLVVVAGMLMLPRLREAKLLRQIDGDVRRQAGPGALGVKPTTAPVEEA